VSRHLDSLPPLSPPQPDAKYANWQEKGRRLLTAAILHNTTTESPPLPPPSKVDAKHVSRHLDEVESDPERVSEAVEQVALADIILLNKTDLVSE